MNTPKIIIAGPCAAESRDQLFETAKELSAINAPVSAGGDIFQYKLGQLPFRLTSSKTEENTWTFPFFRVGIWKARTKPNDFQGAGEEAFAWLKEIKEQFGFKICVEAASKEHALMCMANEIDAIWIGARTTVNPFLVQEIADTVKGSSLTVLVKNPINPDISLWIGAIQRFQNAGIKNVLAVHRGFSVENENVYRNAPCWEIPMALKMKLPNTLMLCDISHITGDVALQHNLAQTAINYGFDGLMAEVHYAPEKALSDKKQQLLPAQLDSLLKTTVCQPSVNEANNALFIQRSLIKNIDIQISKLLSKRMETVDEIAAIKAKHNLPLLQPDQWKKVVALYEENALKDENYAQFLEEFLLLLHKSSLKRQE